MKYKIAKYNAQQFANEKNQPVYIAKATKLNKFEVLFNKTDVTINYSIWETIYPIKNKDLGKEK